MSANTIYSFKNDPLLIFEEFADTYTAFKQYDCSLYSGDGYEFRIHKVIIVL